MTLFGWDASDYDWGRGPMDLAAAARDGIVWFTHKATEGTSTVHVHTGEALSRARAAGILYLGVYHVVRSGPSINAQVAYLLTRCDAVAPWWRNFPGWFFQVDLEKWSYDQVSAATGIAFAAALQQAQPKTVLTYASKGQYGDTLRGITTPVWNASYGTNPTVGYRQAYPGDNSTRWAAYSGVTPVMLQYGSQTTIGSQPGCDANAFRGSLVDLDALIGGDVATLDQIYSDTHDTHELVKWNVHPWVSDVVKALGRIEPVVNALTISVQAMSTVMTAGGGSIDTTAVLAKMQELADAEIAREQAHVVELTELRARLAEALGQSG